MTAEKPKPKQLLRPITTGTNRPMNQSEFLAITCNSPEAREKSRVHGAIGFGFGFGFASHWLKNWRKSFKPIAKLSNRNHVITFDSHLKTALIQLVLLNAAQRGYLTTNIERAFTEIVPNIDSKSLPMYTFSVPQTALFQIMAE